MVKEVTEVVKCDVCGTSPGTHLSFPYDRRCDAAGSMENIYYDIDLCTMHKYEVDRIRENYNEKPKKITRYNMSASDRADLKDKIVMIQRNWENMSAGDQALAKEILRLGVGEVKT